MAYYTALEDLKNYAPATVLQQLTDDNHTNKIDVEKINYAIKQASDYIDMHMQGRYTTPLSPVTDMVRDMATKLTIYFLYRRSLILTLPDVVKSDYKEVLEHLKEIQRGVINIMPETQNPEAFVAASSSSNTASISTITNDWQGYFI
jgi:phage gp36-like protein